MRFLIFTLLIIIPLSTQAQDAREDAADDDATSAQAAKAPAATDGDSVFAKNLLRELNEIEYVSYLRAFVAVMEKGAPDTTYQWNTKTAAGKIIAGAPYVTRTHQHCRGFSESYKVKSDLQYLAGIACKNDQGGWCKLRTTSTPNCIHTHPDGFAGVMLDTNIAIDNMNIGAQRMGNNFNSFKANLPF